MAKNSMTIGKRIGLGFTITLSLTLITGAAGYWGLTRFSNAHHLYQKAARMQLNFNSIQKDLTKYVLYSYAEGREDQKVAFANLKKTLNQIKTDMDRLTILLSMVENGAEKTDAVKIGVSAYEDAIAVFTETENKKMALNNALGGFFSNLSGFIKKGQFRMEKMEFLSRQIEAVRLGYVSRHTDKRWKRIKADLEALETEIVTWRSFVENSKKLKPVSTGIWKNFSDYRKQVIAYHQLVTRQKDIRQAMDLELEKLRQAIQVLADDADRITQRAKWISLSIIMWVVGASIFIGVIYAFISSRKIRIVLQQTIDGIMKSSADLSHASSEISSVSQLVADGATNQVVFLEDTSRTLEETVVMAKKSSANAGEANRLIESTTDVVGKADIAMVNLTTSMSEISHAGDETSKIIKDIEDIAFQTNLLALNAAVEAARAGDAGSGFSVVAEEVRNLAMRSAEAAKNSAYLIDETISKVKTGDSIVSETNDAFEQIRTRAEKLRDLLAAIGSLSNDQVGHIEKINEAIREIEKVSQQNAATSEESASASKELNGQADNLRGLVDRMKTLVTASKKGVTPDFNCEVKTPSPLLLQ